MADPFMADVPTDCEFWLEICKELREQASTAKSFRELAITAVSELRCQLEVLVKQVREATDREQVKFAEDAIGHVAQGLD